MKSGAGERREGAECRIWHQDAGTADGCGDSISKCGMRMLFAAHILL
jgi:hypothetical protein